MNYHLSADNKMEFQQRYRRFKEYFSQSEKSQAALVQAKSSRIWIIGVIALFCAFESEFFLGMAAAFIGTYCYQVLAAYIKKSQSDERVEELTRWFKSKGIMLQDATAFFRDDDQLSTPIDLFDDAIYQ